MGPTSVMAMVGGWVCTRSVIKMAGKTFAFVGVDRWWWPHSMVVNENIYLLDPKCGNFCVNNFHPTVFVNFIMAMESLMAFKFVDFTQTTITKLYNGIRF